MLVLVGLTIQYQKIGTCLSHKFHPLEQEDAARNAHMTVDNAARVAKRAGAKRAVLVHTSPRYREEDINGLDAAAKKRFERAEIGRDLNRYALSPSS